jgi:hypothetical protein
MIDRLSELPSCFQRPALGTGWDRTRRSVGRLTHLGFEGSDRYPPAREARTRRAQRGIATTCFEERPGRRCPCAVHRETAVFVLAALNGGLTSEVPLS